MRKISLNLFAGVSAIFAALIAPAVFAASTTTTFQVNADVVGSCNVSAANLGFGNYDSISPLPTDGSTTVTVQCGLATIYTVGLDQGTGAGATVATRQMTKGSDLLGYSLYQDVTRLLVWGNTPGSDTVAGVGTGLAVPMIVYGRIAAGQNVPSGTYVDTITVSVNF